MKLRIDPIENADTSWPVVLFIVTVFLGSAWPKFTPLILVGCLGLIWGARSNANAGVDIAAKGPGVGHAGALTTLVAITLAVYAAIAAFWSPDTQHGLQKAVTLITVTCGVIVVARTAHLLRPLSLDAAFHHASNGLILAICLVIFEFLSGMAFSHAVLRMGDFADPQTRLSTTFLNRHLTALSLLALPFIYAVWPSEKAGGKGTYIRPAIIAILLAIAAALSEKETAKLALATSVCVFMVALRLPKSARLAVFGAWVAATLLVVPASNWLKANGLHRASEVQMTGRARISIWGVFGEKTLDRPVFGHGTHATRTGLPMNMTHDYLLDHEEIANGGRTTETLYHPRHPHNSFLQVWYELGAVGATLLFAMGAMLLVLLGGLSRAGTAFGLAAFSLATLTASLTHSLWQEWYLAAFGASAALFALADAKARLARET